MMHQSHKTILITGCSTGIGKALALEFSKHQTNVYASARNIDALSWTDNTPINKLTLDVTQKEEMASAVKTIIDQDGKIDILINNAGYAAMGPMAEIPEAAVKQQFDTNITGIILLSQQVIPHMAKVKNGLIVNIGSVSGIMPTPFSGAYCASKAAVHAISDAMRMELSPFGIRVLTVQPGTIQSDFGKNASSSVTDMLDSLSLYKPFEKSIYARAMASQTNSPTTSDEFAAILTKKIMDEDYSHVLRIGKSSFMMPFLKRWLPGKILDAILKKKFGLK